MSSENLELDEPLDLRVRVQHPYSNKNYLGKVFFRIEKFQEGVWKQANSFDYQIRYDRYTFTASDQGEKFFDDLIRFRRAGAFRIFVSTEGGNATYKSLKVREHSSYRSYTPEWFEVSDTSPDENEWVTMSLRIHRANHTQDYEGRVEFRVEEYRNGSWR